MVTARPKPPAVAILPVTAKLTSAPDASGARVQGEAVQTPCRVTSDRLSGAIRATTFVAVSGPAFSTAIEKVTLCPAANGPAVCSAIATDASAVAGGGGGGGGGGG